MRSRAQVATDIGNEARLYATLGALQNDIGIPSDGISVPCRDYDEWVALAFLQGVYPDAWQWAEFETDPEHFDANEWFSDSAFKINTLAYALKEKLTYGSVFALTLLTFVGPDGFFAPNERRPTRSRSTANR